MMYFIRCDVFCVVSCMIYMSYIGHTFSLTVCHSTHCPQINTPTYTSLAINIKLIYSVSIGSTKTSGAPLLFTGA